ncbi:hypothetical protein Taro_030869 [Colocasia esculenta]|uniref:Snakin-2 n=1 Tax=Colocasia esculenta TaxID=4460 RepID=A0A843VZ50_COLES|nr:hypothetical protein [Colocasia esculenta]
MASSRALLALLLLVLALHLVHSGYVVAGEAQPVMRGGSSSLAAAAAEKVNCPGACAVRCSRSWKPKMCLRMCGVCCSRCNCVPSGTGVETRAQCACYANMKNPKGKNKCP